MAKQIKVPPTKNTRALVKSAIRKIWRTFPPRLAALKIACVNPEAKAHDRKYLCSLCLGQFLLQQVEVNHKIPAVTDESLEYFTRRILLDVVSWKSDAFLLHDGSVQTADCLAKENLEVLCKCCHSKLTKEFNKYLREAKKNREKK